MIVLENCLEIDRASCSARNIRRWEKKRRSDNFYNLPQSNLSRLEREKMIYSVHSLNENLRFGEHFRRD